MAAMLPSNNSTFADRPPQNIRLLPWVLDVEAYVWPRVKDARLGKLIVDQLRHAVPCDTIFLAAPPERASPEVGHLMAERRKRSALVGTAY
jgi:hypothetical protein